MKTLQQDRDYLRIAVNQQPPEDVKGMADKLAFAIHHHQFEKEENRTNIDKLKTKIDKLKSSAEFANSLNALEDFYATEPLFFSSTTRQGRPELWARVNELLFSEDAEEEAVEWVLDEEDEEELSDASSEPAPLSDDDLLVF